MDKKLRILILEDVPTDAELIERELQKAKIAFTSRWVDNRDAFLKELEDFSPDIVLSDYSMPHFNGMEALELVKKRFPSIPLIIVTGSMNEETAVECLKNGAADYVIKENMTRLGQAIDGAIKKKRIKQEKKWAIEALKESEEKYRTLFQVAPEGILSADIKTKKLLHANPAFSEMLGYTEEELIQLDISNIHPKEDLDRVFLEFEAQARGEKTLAQNIPCLRKDGTTIYTDIVTAPILIGGRNCNLSFFRDITERKKLETRFVQAQKMETIGTLAGGIAHDFNNILTSVIGFSELALNDAKKGSQQYENLQEVLIAGGRAVDLVKQILTFSRQTDQKKKPVQVKCILEEALKLIRSSTPTTIKIKQNIQSDALVMGDSNHIHQVLINLCANAAHAMEDTGGVLTVDLLDMEFNSNFISNYPDLPPGRYLNLTVTDTGCGMTPDVLDKIFDPFFTTKQKGEGTGMALSVVHGIVRSHGGHIYTHSEPGQGSTFNIFLPAIYKQLKPDDSVDKPVLTGTERILLVDDEPVIVNMSKQLIESLGYDVVTRTSSIEALEFFRRQPESVDLVITDMTMPNMTGDELAVELMKIRPDIPVILCTGFSTRIDEQKSKAKGIRAFVLKPIIKQNLSETIREVLDR